MEFLVQGRVAFVPVLERVGVSQHAKIRSFILQREGENSRKLAAALPPADGRGTANTGAVAQMMTFPVGSPQFSR